MFAAQADTSCPPEMHAHKKQHKGLQQLLEHCTGARYPDNVHHMQAKNRSGLQHEGLQKLLGHLESSAPPCMSDAPDWEASHGWLGAADARTDALQLPPLHDPGAPLSVLQG